MQISAEIRWFRQQSSVEDWTEWFASSRVHSCAPFEDAPRTDAYLVDSQSDEIGIKRRGDKPGAEIKCLISQDNNSDLPECLRGPVQLWGKWTNSALNVNTNSLVRIRKQRLLRKFVVVDKRVAEMDIHAQTDSDRVAARAGQGAFFELTSIMHENGTAWISIALESFGKLSELEITLQCVAHYVAQIKPPSLNEWILASYPAWLLR